MGCYENPRGLARALTFVFNNAWEGGGQWAVLELLVLCFIHNSVKVGPCSKLKVIKVKTNQHSFKT